MDSERTTSHVDMKSSKISAFAASVTVANGNAVPVVIVVIALLCLLCSQQWTLFAKIPSAFHFGHMV